MNIENWKQANKVYENLVNLSEKDAINTLDGINDLTPEIKRIVMSLITSGEQSSQYFDQNVSEGYDLESYNFSQWQAGKEIGEYQLIEEIGIGGMSKVFSAKRLNSDVQKLVAIKIFSPHVHSKHLKQRFIVEQKILSGLSHPNIIAMHHGETTESGESYIVMELIEKAVSLGEYVKKKNLSTRLKVQMVLDTANALTYAHNNLIIHRDIKPTNIIVSVEGDIKLVDFGIAKKISKEQNRENNTTIMALTPSYAAPEQINAEKITVATDIFSLAAVCVSIIIGKEPLPKDRLLKSCEGDEEYLRKIFKTYNFDKDLRNILNQAMQTDPSKRYNSMDKFAEDLQAWLNNKPVSATADSMAYRLSKFAKRRRALFASLVTLVLSMTVALIALSWQYNKTRIEAQKAQQIKQFMLDAFEVTDPDHAKGTDISAKDLLKLASNKLQHNKDLNTDIKFELLQTIGLAYGKQGLYNDSIQLLKQSLKIDPDNSKSSSYLAQYLFSNEQFDQLDNLITQNSINEISDGKDKARFYRIQTKTLINNSDFDAAKKLIDKAINLKSKDIHEDLLNKRLLAELYHKQSHNHKSIGILEGIIASTTLRDDHTLMLAIRGDLAKLYDEIGQADLSIKQWKKIIQQMQTILGDRHPNLAQSLASLAAAYRHTGNITEAFNTIKEAYRINVELTGENSLSSGSILNTHAMLYFDENNLEKAIEMISKVVDIYETQENYQDSYVIKTNLATMLSQSGKYQESHDLILEIYHHQLNKLGENNYDTLSSQQLLARNLVALNRTDDAISMAQSAVDNAQIYLKQGSNNDILAGTYYTLAKIYQSDKQYHLAITNMQKIIDHNLIDKEDTKFAIIVFSMAKLYDEMDDFKNAKVNYITCIKRFNHIFTKTHPRTLLAQILYAKLLKNNNEMQEYNTLFKTIEKIIIDDNIQNPRVLSEFDALRKL